jgi:hypothetical protein
MNNSVLEQKLNSIWQVLKYTYVLVPIIAGLDKFTNLLVNWQAYLNPALLKMLPVSSHTFMMAVGVIEIAAGILVFANPRVGGYIVSAWLVLIAVNLIAAGMFDVAVRDLVMSVGAISMVRITALVQQTQTAFSPKLAGQRV